MPGSEVGHTDGAGAALVDQLLHGAPGLFTLLGLGRGPVHEVEVDVVQTEALEALFGAAQRVRATLVALPDLGGHEQLLAGEPGVRESGADTILVAVDRRCVDAAVAV